MVKQVIQVIQITTVMIAFVYPVYFVICTVEPAIKTAEKLCHGEIGFCVSDINSRVDQPCFSVWSCDEITGPEVTVEQGRVMGF